MVVHKHDGHPVRYSCYTNSLVFSKQVPIVVVLSLGCISNNLVSFVPLLWLFHVHFRWTLSLFISVVSRLGSVAGTLVVKSDDANYFVFWSIMHHKQGKQSDHGRIFSLQSEINLEGATEPNPLVDVSLFSHYVCFKRKCIDIVRRNSSLVTPRRKRANWWWSKIWETNYRCLEIW